MTRQFILTLKPDTALTGINVQAYIDSLRKQTHYVQMVTPIIEMGTPLAVERIEYIRGTAEAVMAIEHDAPLLQLGAFLQELLTEVDRARLAELVTSKALQVAAHERKELEQKVSVLEQRLAQFGPVEERR